jgi:UDP-2-acetamido-2,6-beta-L-arabino-hexul-4-ose reductase
VKVLVTGANGFIGKNLIVHLRERKNIEILVHTKEDPLESLAGKVFASDFIFHLAGVNRPVAEAEFTTGNVGLTNTLCQAIQSSGRKIPVIFSSSIQAERDNPYGKSKSEAESALLSLSKKLENPVFIYRLPNVFGKWCKPNYNSVVATFCHNIAHDLPIQVNDPKASMQLVYIDDVISSFLKLLDGFSKEEASFQEVQPVYKPYFKPEQFSYTLVKHEDPRGVFVEMLKTKDSGQFSFFTAHKGITRGGHYHHSKNEKFLIVKGEARFCFRHILTNETFEINTKASNPEVVETIPGWSHDITNIGEDEMIVMLWANEIFDQQHPDTIAYKVSND